MGAPVEALTLAEARSAIDRTCRLLCSPSATALEECATLMREAIAGLESLNFKTPELPGPIGASNERAIPSGAARREAVLLRSGVELAGSLLCSAVDYYDGWRRVAGTLCAGYTDRGQAGATLRPPRLYLRG